MAARKMVVVGLLLALVSGCGGSTLRGKVSYRERPVLSGSVIALQADGTARSGVIQPDGSYEVEGLSRGPVRLGVLSPDPARARSILPTPKVEARGGKRPRTKPGTNGWYPLPASLGDPEKSGLTCELTAARVEFDIKIH